MIKRWESRIHVHREINGQRGNSHSNKNPELEKLDKQDTDDQKNAKLVALHQVIRQSIINTWLLRRKKVSPHKGGKKHKSSAKDNRTRHCDRNFEITIVKDGSQKHCMNYGQLNHVTSSDKVKTVEKFEERAKKQLVALHQVIQTNKSSSIHSEEAPLK